jgi:hypothetical protein
MVHILTKGRPLTEADFENELPMPGSSDRCYSHATLNAFRRIVVTGDDRSLPTGPTD